MGLTPLEGLPGGSRSGTVDPSLAFHLFPETVDAGQLEQVDEGIKIARAERFLNKESGVRFGFFPPRGKGETKRSC
jgi:acetate kinase